MRHLPNVIDQMLREVPSTETDMIAQLEDTKSSAEYSAPESVGFWWHQTVDILMDFIPDPEKVYGWRKKVVDIWMDRP